MMDTEEILKYEKMFEALHSEGWGLIRERLVDMFNAQNNVLAISDDKSFWQARGALGMLHLIIEFESALKAETASAENEAEEEFANDLE
tara:strand:+ start:165 stop:431 length:267 start_codon:yes stop_codon:yes gene_type:complete